MKKIISFILALSITMIPFQTVYAENSADSSLSAEENFIPSDWHSAFDFLIDNGANSETNGRQLVEVIPVARSEDFIIEDSPDTDEVKPYTVETYTYYYYDDSEPNSIGYRVRVYTIRDGIQVSDGYTLNHTTKTTYIYDGQKKSDIYKLNYYIDPVTMTFRKLSIIPENYREAGRFERKYGTFAVDENTKQVVAVVHANNNNMNENGCIYEPFVTHEIKGTAKMTSSQTFSRDHYIKLYSGEGIISNDSGNKVMTFDASEKGNYTIRIKMLLMGDPYYYNINYSVDDDGKITLGETFNYPDTINCDDDAETLFKGKNLYQGNGGFLINQGDTIQIALPKDDYKIVYNNLSVLGSERLINTEKFSKYMVYTYNLEPIPAVNDVAENILDGDFEIKFISGEDFYTFRFNCINDIVTNTGILSNDSGDANGDGNIDIADIITLSAFTGNPQNNRISDKAKIYCDVHSHGNGIDASDVLMIQQYIANVITEF
ncbi:MAG: hypothetical protein ACI4K5_02725 [Ruminococcus sp.]